MSALIIEGRSLLFFPSRRTASMAAAGSGSGEGCSVGGDGGAKPNVTDLLRKLQLTEDEGAIADFSDDEEIATPPLVEWAVIGKVLSPSTVHVNTVRAAMKPAWGNPYGLKFRAIGQKCDNMFVAELGSKAVMERVLAGAPWMVGRHAVILKEYDEKLSASEIVFDRMEIWARIHNLSLGWMNQQQGSRAMSLIGTVIKMDVDADGKASGAFLRARVAIEIDKPLRRGVLLRMSRLEEPKWFAVQYEKLPFFCYGCGIMGHSEIECLNPVPHNEAGKFPYDVQLRAPEERRRKAQAFADAAAESFGSGSSSGSRPPRTNHSKSGAQRSFERGSCHTSSEPRDEEYPEVQSPLKAPASDPKDGASDGTNRRLNMDIVDDVRQTARKRKSKASMQTPDLNIPVGANAIIPVGLVNSRVNQLRGNSDCSGGSVEEAAKKQRRGSLSQNANSAAAAGGSPRRAQ